MVELSKFIYDAEDMPPSLEKMYTLMVGLRHAIKQRLGMCDISDLFGRLLETIFYIQSLQINFSQEEREFIGPQLLAVTPAVEDWCIATTVEMTRANFESYKVERSGLQFLLEDYVDFPTGSLLSLHSMDRYSDRVYDWDSEFQGHQIRNTCTVEDARSKLDFVPKSHWWWGKDKPHK